MKLPTSAVWAMGAAGLCALGGVWITAKPRPTSAAQALSKPRLARSTVQARAALQTLARLPLHFEANMGQAGGDVKFVSRATGGTLLLSPSQALLALPGKASGQSGEGVATRLVGANPSPKIVGEEPLRGKSNYFRGNDPKKWVRNVPHYAKVRMRDVYPGIDLVYYGRDGKLEYDFMVRPGADPGGIQLAFDSSSSVKLTESGDLSFALNGHDVRHRRPVAYQESKGIRRPVTARWAIRDRNHVQFDVSGFDPSRPLVIDPVLEYSTFLGGNGGEFAEGVHADETGIYVGGYTASSDFPTTLGAFQQVSPGGSLHYDCFVTKLTPDGSSLIYSTYLGGAGDDLDGQTCVDATGCAYISGTTAATDFPTTPNAFQRTNRGGYDAFVAKISADGSSLVYSTLLGGTANDFGRAMEIDESGYAYVTGSTNSSNLPTTAGAYDCSYNGGGDLYAAKVSPDGRQLLFLTYLGGSASEATSRIRVGADHCVYLAGSTNSPDFPVTQGAFQTAFGGNSHASSTGDLCVAKLDPSGSRLLYATFVGGSNCESIGGLAVDNAGSAYVVGWTDSPNFPITLGAYQSALADSAPGSHQGRDAYITKLSTDGSALLASTYLGGSDADSYTAVTVGSDGTVYVAGYTHSLNAPTVNPIQESYAGGGGDWHVAALSADLSSLLFATYLGGSGWDTGGGAIYLAPGGALWVVGNSTEGWPITPTAYQSVCRGNPQMPTGNQTDVGIVKIVFNHPPTMSVDTSSVTVDEGQTATNALNVSDPDNDPLAVTASFGSVSQDGNGEWIWSFAATDGPAQSQTTVAINVSDGKGGTATAEFILAVNNVAPVLEPIVAPPTPTAVRSTVNASAVFADPGTLDTHTAAWDWGDGSQSVGTVNETAGSGTASGQHIYNTPGVYTLTLTVTDKDGAVASTNYLYVVVYDPDGGFVTGGGWINSAAGAYEANPSLSGRATFGFNAKYQHGNNVPDGQTEFQFRVADLNFHSSSYEWLVVSGPRAQFRGEGTVNGQGGYRFMITAIDGQHSGGGGFDKFRIRIWNDHGLVYDNQKGTSDDGQLGDETKLGGGSIVIHD